MFRLVQLLLIALSVSVSYSLCAVRPEFADSKYGTPGGCAREAWQNKESCEKHPNLRYCIWSE